MAILMRGDGMAKKIELCGNCHNQCDIPCEALTELRKIYKETRTKEKKQLIYRIRKLLNIVDAEPANDLKRLAQKIIKKLPELSHIPDFDIKIGYVRSYERRTSGGRPTYADCRKINKVYAAYLPFDFIVTFYELNIGHLSENQLKILMWHELKHIGVGKRGFVIEPHDIEDFFTIIDSYSTRWDEFGMEVKDILE